MYINIKRQIQKNPGWKTLTLSGNIHNMIKPYKGVDKMACYLKADKDLKIGEKLCSLNHQYRSGQMINNTGTGLKLRPAGVESDYSTAVNYDNYLLLPIENKNDSYHGILFSRYVTAAKMVTIK
jgi:hypothetical protein